MLAFLAGCWLGFCVGIVLAAVLQMSRDQMNRDGARRQAREP